MTEAEKMKNRACPCSGGICRHGDLRWPRPPPRRLGAALWREARLPPRPAAKLPSVWKHYRDDPGFLAFCVVLPGCTIGALVFTFIWRAL